MLAVLKKAFIFAVPILREVHKNIGPVVQLG